MEIELERERREGFGFSVQGREEGGFITVILDCLDHHRGKIVSSYTRLKERWNLTDLTEIKIVERIPKPKPLFTYNPQFLFFFLIILPQIDNTCHLTIDSPPLYYIN